MNNVNKIKVLVVDDHAIMRDGIRALLGVCDDLVVVGEAADGAEAIGKTKELAPDVIVMDIAMPGMDGLEATRRIKQANPKAKVLILTQYSNREYVVSGVKAGAAGYVPKGALSSELISAIRAVYHGDSFLHPSVTKTLIEDYRQRAEEEPYDRLTAREREILKLLADGHTAREISGMLFISLKTVMGHRTRVMAKLGLHSRTELIKYAVRKGLTTTDA